MQARKAIGIGLGVAGAGALLLMLGALAATAAWAPIVGTLFIEIGALLGLTGLVVMSRDPDRR